MQHDLYGGFEVVDHTVCQGLGRRPDRPFRDHPVALGIIAVDDAVVTGVQILQHARLGATDNEAASPRRRIRPADTLADIAVTVAIVTFGILADKLQLPQDPAPGVEFGYGGACDRFRLSVLQVVLDEALFLHR